MPSLLVRMAVAMLSIAVAVVTGDAGAAGAACTNTGDAGTLMKSILKVAHCNNKILRAGPGASCSQTSPPACAGTIAADAIALAYGRNNPSTAAVDRSALRDQLNCQRQLGRAAARFVGVKLRSLITGHPSDPARADAIASKELDKIATRCAVHVAEAGNVRLPSVGPECAAAIGAPGSPVDSGRLRDCLHNLLTIWVERQGPNPPPLPPNIIVIITDDQRADSLPFMPTVTSELVGKGISFTNAFSATPACCPSRATMLTGQYTHSHGVTDNAYGATQFDDSSTVATRLAMAGYRTALIGKYLNGYGLLCGSDGCRVPPGWTEWAGQVAHAYYNYDIVEDDGWPTHYGGAEADYSTDVFRDRALAFLDRYPRDPVFVYLAAFAPHDGGVSTIADIPVPAARHMYVPMPYPSAPPNLWEADVSDKPLWVQALEVPPSHVYFQPQRRQIGWRSLLAVDDAVAAIVAKLSAQGRLADTVIIYTSDHGLLYGEHRYVHKSCLYEECNRIPFVLRYDRLSTTPETREDLASLVDLAPTIGALAQATADGPVDGMDLVAVREGTLAPRTQLLIEGIVPQQPFTYPPRFSACRTAQWKYGVIWTTGEEELYDLIADPYELTNVAAEHPDVVASMRSCILGLGGDVP